MSVYHKLQTINTPRIDARDSEYLLRRCTKHEGEARKWGDSGREIPGYAAYGYVPCLWMHIDGLHRRSTLCGFCMTVGSGMRFLGLTSNVFSLWRTDGQ